MTDRRRVGRWRERAEVIGGESPGERLVARYRAGGEPVGSAIVRAAVDCRRTGLTRPLTEAELWRLVPLYLQDVDLVPTAEEFAAGLLWAGTEILPGDALLTGAGTGQWDVTPRAVAADSERPIPGGLWYELIELLTADEAFDLGCVAHARQQPDVAIAAFRKVSVAAGTDRAPEAAFNLGTLLKENGEPDAARVAYQSAIDSGHAEAAPMAAVNLGVLLARLGEVDEARRAYQRAIGSGHPGLVPNAAFNLGNLLADRGEPEAAQAAYHLAIDSGHPDHAPSAAFNLGVLLTDQGARAAARAAYETAIASGHADQAPLAAVNLGNLLAEQDDLDGARTAYRLAVDSGHAEAAPLAAFNLGFLTEPDARPFDGSTHGARSFRRSG